MASNGDTKAVGSKLLQYNSTDNTWYALEDLKPKWWFKLEDNLSIVSTEAVTSNEYYFGTAGTEAMLLKSVIPVAVDKVCTTTASDVNIACTAHGFLVGQMLGVKASAAGFTTGGYYYVTTKTDNSFTVSTTYQSGTNTNVTPNASTSVTFYSRASLRMVASVTEGWRSLDTFMGNHINNNYLLGNPLTSGTLSKFTAILVIRSNIEGQAFPTGITPERTLFHLYTDASNSLRVYITSANKFSAQLNDVNALIDYATFTANYVSTPFFIVCRYDGTTLKLSYMNSNITFNQTASASSKTVSYTASSKLTIGASQDGTNGLTKCLMDSFKFYDRYLSDEEVNILYNYGNLNYHCSLMPTSYSYDYARWPLEDTDTSLPINQIGSNCGMSPNTASNNLVYVNAGTGVLVNQTQDGIKCFRFVEASKGYLYMTKDMNADNNFYDNQFFSIGFWLKDTSSTNANRRWLTNNTSSSLTAVISMGVGEVSNATPKLYLASNNNIVYVDYGASTWKNKWNYWTITINGYAPNTMTLYCNGEYVTSISNVVTGGTQSGMYVGGRNATGDSEYVEGYMRDIVLKRYLMTPGEMKRIYNNGKPLRV